jgi:hypothetical protein
MRRVAVVLGLLVALGARAARADEPAPAPGPAGLVVGIAAMAGGGALHYASARHYADDPSTGTGWLLLNSLGALVMQVGGVVETAWGWQLGEHDLALDLASGRPVRQHHPVARVALAAGAVAVIGMYVGIVFVYAKSLGCAVDVRSTAGVRHCAADSVFTISVLDLFAGGLLAVAGPLAGYGLGYEDAAENAALGRMFGRRARLRFGPAYLPGGGLGLGLDARFF